MARSSKSRAKTYARKAPKKRNKAKVKSYKHPRTREKFFKR